MPAKLKMHPVSVNGQVIARDEFGYTLKRGEGFNPAGVDAVCFWCRGGKNRICSVDLTLGEAGDGQDGRRRWHWDGNMEAPTISPSINCSGDRRCGWHGNIISGEASAAKGGE